MRRPPENSEKEERLCVSVLRALCVLAHIKDNRTDDDQALDDVGHVIIDLQHNQAVVDNAEDQDTCQNTGYAADTAGVGGAAYGSRSDSVQLVVQAGVGRISRTCTACQQNTCNSRTNRAPYINHDEVLFYIDAGNAGSLIGIFIALLGQDSVSGTLRFTFGVRRLGAGIPLIVTLVGLFAIAELLSRSDYNPRTDATRKQHLKLDHEKLSWAEIKRCLKTMTISSVIGTIVGAIPGTGGGIAAFISYDQAKKTSKYRDHFGHGEIEGVSATESANNATTGSTLIPLTTLGVPGDGCTAILLGAFMLQGMVPGPSMFKEHSDILYGIMIGLVVINILMLIIGRVFTPLYANITRIPYELMSAIIIVYCITGVYSSEASTFQVLLAVIIGAFSFLLRKLGFGVVPIILGVVLGDLVETNFRNSMVMSGNSLSIFVTRPFSLLFLALAVLSIGMFFYKAAKDRKKQKTELD